MNFSSNDLTSKPETFHIETYGCAANSADSAIMEQLLKEAGYSKSNFDNATFIIINTCGVKAQTENKLIARLKNLSQKFPKSSQKRFIIAGCLPFIAPHYLNKIKKVFPRFSALLDVNSIDKIVEIIKKIENGETNLLFTSEKKLDKSHYQITYPKGKITAITPISEGCLGACTYCCVKNARGKLKSYHPQHIINTIRSQLEQEIKQIYLTSQDCSIYEYDSIQLGDVIAKINRLPFEFFLRLGMVNPAFIANNSVQLKKIFNCNKVYQFLHIPIQSGSNRILKLMRRPYLLKDIIKPLNQLKTEFPNLTISTDIICGFPTETEYDFYRTINFIKWLNPEIINISKYTIRPETPAKKMKQVESGIIKQRSSRLSALFRRSLNSMNNKWKGWKGKVLLLHRTSKNHQIFGRNFAYKNVFIDEYEGTLGIFVDVEITRCEGFNLFGKIIKK